jgi:hypothetical protein
MESVAECAKVSSVTTLQVACNRSRLRQQSDARQGGRSKAVQPIIGSVQVHEYTRPGHGGLPPPPSQRYDSGLRIRP